MMKLQRSVKRYAVLLLGAVLGGPSAFGFGLESHGINYGSLLGFSSGLASHSDLVSWTNEPSIGARPVEFLGKIGASWAYWDGLCIVPQAGEPTSGTVPVQFSYSTTETLLSAFDNFADTPFGYHFAWKLKLYEASHLFTPVDTFTLSHDNSSVLLNLGIGSQYFLTCEADAASVNQAMQNPDWVPTVLNPDAPGLAWLSVEGCFTPGSIQLVPEPASCSLGLLGLLAWCCRRRTVR
jgi:hypothetical protein